MAWCLEVRCVQPLLNGSPRCYYHDKVDRGLMTDSFGKRHAAPPGHPDLEPIGDDGWISLGSGVDHPLVQLVRADRSWDPELVDFGELGNL